MTRAFIAFGSNLGDREHNIRAALAELDRPPQIQLEKVSSFIENAAIGMAPDSPPFLNGVAQVETTTSAHDLMHRLLRIEQTLGRVRTSSSWQPRVIDLDLLMFGDEIIDEPGLTLPHPRMTERRFVLEPLAEIAPDYIHPVHHKSMSALLAAWVTQSHGE